MGINDIKLLKPKVCRRCWNRNNVIEIEEEFVEEERNCPLCLGSFLRLDEISEKIIKQMGQIASARTFSIGTSFPKKSEVFEEKIWDQIPIENAKSVKPVLNAEICKKIEEKTKYKFSIDPDVRIIYEIENDRITAQISSLYLYGRYNKLERGVRQTKKKGSKEESVEGLIEKILIKIVGTRNSKVILHGSGREDIDVLMLGSGRPFIAEITNPNKRELSKEEIKTINEEINKEFEGKIRVAFERVVKREFVEIIKRAKFDKEYIAIVKSSRELNEEEIEDLPKEITLLQRTPTRVLIRRADKIRKRKIKKLEAEYIDKNTIKLRILAQSGTYIKEFINGDNGRTTPSISSLLNTNAICERLDVVSIDTSWFDDFW